MDKSEWETIKILSESNIKGQEPLLPIDIECPFEDIIKQILDLQKEHKGNYDELRFLYCWEGLHYESTKKWYELQGRYSTTTKKVLYGCKIQDR